MPASRTSRMRPESRCPARTERGRSAGQALTKRADDVLVHFAVPALATGRLGRLLMVDSKGATLPFDYLAVACNRGETHR